MHITARDQPIKLEFLHLAQKMPDTMVMRPPLSTRRGGFGPGRAGRPRVL